MDWIKRQISETYHSGGTAILCAFGGAIWVSATQIGETGWSWAGFIFAGILWAFALDLERQKAHAKGFREGTAHTIAAIEACDGLDITITHTDKAEG